MELIRVLYHIARADFFERTRRYSFLVTTGILIYLAYLSFPPMDATYLVVGMGDFRGIYNSAWIGSSIALLCNTMLSLIGFYLVNNSIKRDYETGVGQIIATTQLSKWAYLIGKMLSNLVFLMSMVAIVVLAGIGMQLFRGESTSIRLWEFISPLLLTTLPIMAIVSSVAIFFEAIKWLRGGFGNVLYYALLMAVMMATLGFESNQVERDTALDPFGLTIIVGSMQKTLYHEYPEYQGGFAIGGSPVEDHVRTFDWEGVEWTPEIILWRMMWILFAFIVTSIVTLFFKRFDLSYKSGKRKFKFNTGLAESIPELSTTNNGHVILTPIAKLQSSNLSTLTTTVLAELKIMLKGLHKLWYVVALVLIILSMALPLEVVREFIVPVAWVWPLLIWSKMGNKEIKFRTNQYVFASPNPVIGQLPAVWLAGFIVAVITGIGWPLRMLFAGELQFILPWLVGAAFIPTLALTLGVWSGSSKLFEVVYFMLWYIGPMNRVPYLDFIGTTGQRIQLQIPIYFLVITLLLVGLAIVGRKRQICI